MSDFEISRTLALALGWVEADMTPIPVGLLRISSDAPWIMRDDRLWSCFDYRDWNVIGPIAEAFFAFPSQFVDEDGKVIAWEANLYSEKTGGWHSLKKADTPQKAIALAVIDGIRSGRAKV